MTLNYCQGTVIDTSATLVFTGSNITCALNESCSIYCDEYIGDQGPCQSSIIHCPSDYDCDISCSTDYACKESTILCPLNGECNINCFGYSACQDLDIIKGNTEPTLACSDAWGVCRSITFPIPPSDEAMELYCGGSGCRESTIYCPTNADCDIFCTDC